VIDGDDFICRIAAAVLTGAARILDPAVELAVGEDPGAAFAELRIAFPIEDALAAQAPSIFGALPCHVTALYDDRPEPHLRKRQRCK
jgi:hypothetical protein